jgi:hypothetical protein
MSDEPKKPSGERRYSFFPKPLKSCIEPLTRPLLKAQGLASSRLLGEWENIVGRELAGRCIPQKLSFPAGKTTGGTLAIAAENGFATELQHMQPVILERLASYFGYKAVARIAISHSFLPPAPKTVLHVPTPTLAAGCVAIAQEATDSELKAALSSFAETLSGKRT